MNPIISELRTLLKYADTLQDLEYEKKEVRRKKTQAIKESFFVKRAITEYAYLKGLELKSFIVMQSLVWLVTFSVFIIGLSFFQSAWGAFTIALGLGALTNIWFVLGYKPYKLPEWYLTGAIFFGLLITLFGSILLAYASIVFFTESGPFWLVLLGILIIHLVITYLIGGIFPGLYNWLDRRAFRNAELHAQLKAIEAEEKAAIQAIDEDVASYDRKIKDVQKDFDAVTIVPNKYKAYKTLKMLIYYLEENKASSIDEAMKRFDSEDKDALRQMKILSV